MAFSEGFKEAAEKFRLESGIEPGLDLGSLDERLKIRDVILNGQIQEAIALINGLHPELLDTNRYLYFHLQVLCHLLFPILKKMYIYIIMKFTFTIGSVQLLEHGRGGFVVSFWSHTSSKRKIRPEGHKRPKTSNKCTLTIALIGLQ